MSKYTSQFSTLSNKALLEIINNADNYDVLAVETARIEIDSRNLNQDDYAEIKSQEFEKEEKVKEIEAVHQFTLKKIRQIIDFINPFTEKSEDYGVKGIAILIALNGLTALYHFLNISIWMLRHSTMPINQYEIMGNLFGVILIIAGILLWQKKKSGWILSNIILLMGLISLFYFLCFLLFGDLYINLYTASDIIIQTIIICFIGFLTYFLNKKKSKKLCEISEDTRNITWGISILLCAVLIVGTLLL